MNHINDNNNKFEVSLHFWGIWPTVRYCAAARRAGDRVDTMTRYHRTQFFRMKKVFTGQHFHRIAFDSSSQWMRPKLPLLALIQDLKKACNATTLGLGHRTLYRLRTPNEDISPRNLKHWADVADKMCFGHTKKMGLGFNVWPCSEGYFLSERP